MRTGKLLLVGVAVFAILLAACSSDDDDPTASATGSMGSADPRLKPTQDR